METLMGQVYNPHLKKVLKTYQLSAPKSLQGPSTVLSESQPSQETGASPISVVVRTLDDATPPPLPVLTAPILTAPDRGPSLRTETLLEGEKITCFLVGGEKRLCLPQILNSILRDFTLAQINQVCDELQIFCSRCNPEQLEELKETGILPKTAPSCGLITKTDAERLASTLLHRPLVAARLPELSVSFKVYHECFGKCKGLCLPELYVDAESRCIECSDCGGLLSPRQFVCHSHRPPEGRTCHWGFDSDNWRAYLLLAQDQPQLEVKEKLLEHFKEQTFDTAIIKQDVIGSELVSAEKAYPSPLPTVPNKVVEVGGSPGGGKRADTDWETAEEEEVIAAKKLKLSDDFEESPPPLTSGPPPLSSGGGVGPPPPTSGPPPPYIPPQYDYSYYAWYDPFMRSAFRPWHAFPPPPPLAPSQLDEKPPPYRDSCLLKKSIPAYLNRDPPVLLHPERVVPLSETERFERSYQPNVALAPRPPHSGGGSGSGGVGAASANDSRRSQIHLRTDILGGGGGGNTEEKRGGDFSQTDSKSLMSAYVFHPEIELSTDTDDSASEHHDSGGGGGSSAVEQVAAVFAALSDAKETTRQLVVGLVERLAGQLDTIQAENKRLLKDNVSLLQQIHKVRESRSLGEDCENSSSSSRGQQLREEQHQHQHQQQQLGQQSSEHKSSSCLPDIKPAVVVIQSPTPAESPPPTSPQRPLSPGQQERLGLSKRASLSPLSYPSLESSEAVVERRGIVPRSSPVSVITSPPSIKAEPLSE